MLKKHFIQNQQTEKNKLTAKKRKRKKRILIYNDDYSIKKSVSLKDLDINKKSDEDNRRKKDTPKEVPMFLNMYDPFRNNLEIVQSYLRKEKLEQHSHGLDTIEERKSSIESSKSKIN